MKSPINLFSDRVHLTFLRGSCKLHYDIFMVKYGDETVTTKVT